MHDDYDDFDPDDFDDDEADTDPHARELASLYAAQAREAREWCEHEEFLSRIEHRLEPTDEELLAAFVIMSRVGAIRWRRDTTFPETTVTRTTRDEEEYEYTFPARTFKAGTPATFKGKFGHLYCVLPNRRYVKAEQVIWLGHHGARPDRPIAPKRLVKLTQREADARANRGGASQKRRGTFSDIRIANWDYLDVLTVQRRQTKRNLSEAAKKREATKRGEPRWAGAERPAAQTAPAPALASKRPTKKKLTPRKPDHRLRYPDPVWDAEARAEGPSFDELVPPPWWELMKR